MNCPSISCPSLPLSKIGLGTWAIGGGGWKFGWGPQDDKESIKTIRRALELGVNWIDTAPLYGFGHAEEIVARALKGTSLKPYISTKCGLSWNYKREVSHNLTEKSIRTEIEQSLRRLRYDCIDIYFIHWPSPAETIPEAWLLINKLIKEGKVRTGGISNFNSDQFNLVSEISTPAFAQNEFNILKREALSEFIPSCVKAKIKFIAYGVLCKGLTTGKFNRERVESLPFDDHRKRDSEFVNLMDIGKIQISALEKNLSPAQYSIQWALEQEGVHAVICGMRTVKQVEENLLSIPV
jgi:aryl-alcohol dehydrogenase-like predicted oxidoreductase